MEWKIFATVFVSVFVAELGDKTQLATMLFASNKEVSRLTVFLGSALALITTSALGVLAGTFLSRFISEKQLSIAAGIAFVAIGAWTLYKALVPGQG
jgi:putative Ca2+/H+ antiporter (TMEM165/GDT1 family)